MGRDALDRTYDSNVLATVREMPGMTIVASKDELTSWLLKQNMASLEVIAPVSAPLSTPSEQIINIALGD